MHCVYARFKTTLGIFKNILDTDVLFIRKTNEKKGIFYFYYKKCALCMSNVEGYRSSRHKKQRVSAVCYLNSAYSTFHTTI